MFGMIFYKLKEIRDHKYFFRKCKRCGLYSDVADYPCGHCGKMDEKELIEFLKLREREVEGNNNLGLVFGVVAVVISLLIMSTFF
ncbi:hypothetical protein HNQ53_003358 [Microbulbifer hydrolyticus]|uniref:Uncharacterized protein n=1 Tax=Microbulbifer hydrolyticus TaxID=48074 RepID=A0AA89PKI1_9GAMM|nr:hypothetical protein [Microbulbifer hydrolyticus]